MVKKLKVLGKEISIKKFNNEDFISLTDMIKAKDGDFFISDWLRNRNTVEFLGIWERIYNPNFNYGEYATIRNKTGLNNYKISVKQWAQKTNAIGLKAISGRYGGTYAHKDLAFEFGMWISAEFKIYLIKEFQRLKEEENKNNDWNVKRILTKINYQIHTSAIKENLIPFKITKKQISQIYASEADILNVALYGKTANEWIKLNKKKQGNLRDYSNVSQLICLSNLESLNSVFIKSNLNQQKRLIKLNQIAISQMKILTQNGDVDKLTDKKLVLDGKK